jgi:hypothetical protein
MKKIKDLLKKIQPLSIFFVLFFVGCASIQRDCSGCSAETFGADWVVVQVDYRGQPFRCWTLRSTSITNEEHSDGIWWRAPEGNLVHISGFYNRVQVVSGNWNSAYRELGLTEQTCRNIANSLVELNHDN